MKIIDKNILNKLKKNNPASHKGQNGRLLIIAGSDKFHGALLLAMKTASRIVDMVYVHSVEQNIRLIDKLKMKMSTFITVVGDELWETINLVDVILIGPGLEENRRNKKLVEKILKKYSDKKILVDATALWHVDPLLLHENCVVTPHSREFENTFKCDSIPENVLKMAKYYQCNIVLTGKDDFISNGKEIYKNTTGNVGMTKGGTGDVLTGIISSFMTSNNPFISALAGVYLSGLVGDSLKKKVGTFYNADDLIKELGDVWKNNF